VGVQSVDYVLSCTDRNDFVALAGVLAFGGKICCILPAPVADLSGLFRKRGSVSFEWMFARARSGAEPGRQGMLLDRVAELSERGVLTSTMTRVLDWREVRVAHEVIESGHTVGKIVLQVGR
jgi:NADPH2:quinone reductase